MAGASSSSLAVIGRRASIAQSIGVILSTPRGSRVMRRDFGSDVPALLGRALNEKNIMAVLAETADALARWEPRFVLERVAVAADGPRGILTIGVFGRDVLDGAPIETRTGGALA